MKPDRYFCLDCGWSGDEPACEEFTDWVPAPFGTGNVPMITQEIYCPMCGGEVRDGKEEELAAT